MDYGKSEFYLNRELSWLAFNNRILGDATSELGAFENKIDPDDITRIISSWYGDYAGFVNSSFPWFYRGGCWMYGSGAGIFSYYYTFLSYLYIILQIIYFLNIYINLYFHLIKCYLILHM